MSGGRIAGIIVGSIALILGLTLGVWALTVAFSPAQGAGDAYRQKNSAANWTAAQARFEDEYADIVATDRKITLSVPDEDSDRTAKDTYKGLQSYCISVVADYNADARKYLASDFRSADLPAQIDNSNPETDCEPAQ